ncbi:MAG: dipeptidyl-peptidase 3 family protein [Flavobacteriales bacterium]
MRKIILSLAIISTLIACRERKSTTKVAKIEKEETNESNFQWKTDEFADIKVLRYQIPGWEQLSLKQKELVYYLSQAGLSGRDIMWDQNYRHNLKIRKALENIFTNYTEDKNSEEWKQFDTYIKRVWFSNGIHHHYSTDKILPEFSKEYFNSLLKKTQTSLSDEIITILFSPTIDAKKVNLNPKKDLVKGSAANFYSPNMTEADVDAFYAQKIDKSDDTPIEYGLNSKLIKNDDGTIQEKVYKIGGMYSKALEKVVYWLEKAQTVAENSNQAKAIGLLIEYYKTGDLKKWNAFNIAWVEDTESSIDFINGFVEVYNDSKGFRGSYESIIEIKDFDLSKKMAVLSENVQWFEDQSTILPEHKKENVVGVSYKVVNVASEAGDASPSTPIGVNLPNNNWIRATHGSKSVSLGNIIYAYSQAGGSEILNEFAFSPEEIELEKKYGKVTSKMHTALHEVIGHASGKLNKGIGSPKETLKNYASTLEEARADLVGLYYLVDPKLQELGVLESVDAGKSAYDRYIRNGLMTQLFRLNLGDDIEEAHMRNRQLVASWAFEKGQKDNVIEKVIQNDKTYFVIRDYNKLRTIFGILLKEIQRIKSEGDYEAGKHLVEHYGVKVDQTIHKEVLDRTKNFQNKPYGGFINPILTPVTDDQGKITDVQITYANNFAEQMLQYAQDYTILPDEN